ncbi:glycoside hydrolase family 3 N-terminal domain-containing protein [Saccharothrix xinjiangensis]|uniref:Glycoside hydrolase family 3 N-terminal domain-containing protein n=1 Tax=Saccharothrix xinjiangensis TaxID=204798 RepID=A0ABV9Y1F7_9PSEU
MTTDLDAAWRDCDLPVHDRVEALLAAMTLEEKVAQLGTVWLDRNGGSATGSAPIPEVFTASATGTVDDLVRGGIGHLIRVFGNAPVTVAEGVQRLRALQERVVAGNRFGIPAIVHEECLTGFATLGATVYPTPLAWAATFDVEFVREMASAIGRDLRSVGVHQGLVPVLDVVRDYRWSRMEEMLGEDPYLVGQLGAAYARGLEEAGVVATVRHFAGYAASPAARNRALAGIGPRELADVILPPFETALRDGGARSVMSSCTDVDGVPVAANGELFRDLLSEGWAFTGTVVADHRVILFVASMERAFAEGEKSQVLALRAGNDGELPETRSYGERLVGHVRTGGVEESLVDESVRRVLRQKVELGLFDDDPLVLVSPHEVDLDSADNRWVARTVAERSVVLLANDRSTLPLNLPLSRIAIVGACANDPLTLLGCHAFPHQVLRRCPERGAGVPIATIRRQVEAEFPQSIVHYARGAEVTVGDDSGIAEAVHAATLADVVLLFIGDGTAVESCDVPDLSLPGAQDRLVEAVLATGTPTVLVVVSGRPYALGDYAGRAAAVVQAFFPGIEGASAVAGVLSGRINPSGRLPVQVPRLPWVYPSTYLQPLPGAWTGGDSALDPTPLYPFGHGLSYTTVRYETLGLTSDEAPTTGSVEAGVVVRNTGHRAVDEVVQLYASGPADQVTRPPVRLIGFTRVALEPGQARLVVFEVPAEAFSFTGVNGRRVVEPGRITLSTGPSSADLPLSTDVWLTGEPAHPGHDRRLTTTHVIRDLDEREDDR